MPEQQPKPLKAYTVQETQNYEKTVLVFAETVGLAKSMAMHDENMDGIDFTSLRVTRAPYADGHENDSERDLILLKIRNGWYYEIDGYHIDKDNLDEMLGKGIL